MGAIILHINAICTYLVCSVLLHGLDDFQKTREPMGKRSK